MTDKETKTMYMVMKLSNTMLVGHEGEEKEVRIGGALGYVPVYSTVEEAEESSCDAKYKILAITSDIANKKEPSTDEDKVPWNINPK